MTKYHSTQWLCIAAFVILGTGTVRAQGSPYDVIGFGLPVRTGNATIDAMGGVGVALEGIRTVNDLNQADWTWLDQARFGAGLRYDYVNAIRAGNSDVQSNVKFTSASFGAPMWNVIHAAFALGYEPLTDASNQMNLYDPLVGTRTYVSRGGTNLIYGGLAARPIPAISLGARLDYISGDIRHLDQVSFIDTAAGSGEFERDYFFNGLRGTFGIQLIGDSLGLRGLTLGAVYSLATNLNSTQETIVTPLNTTLDTTLDVAGVGYYPAALSAGISYHLSRRYRMEADYFSQDFSNAYVYAPHATSGDSLLRSSNRIAVGIERLPNVRGEYGTSFGFDRWGLRLGLSYGILPVNPAGSGVREFALSGGVGIPISLESLLNLSIAAGQRIPITSGASPNETFVRIGADVSFSETWFVPTPQ